MSQTPIPCAWTLESGVGPCLTSGSLGKIFISESYRMTLAQPGPQFPAALPFSHVLEPLRIFGN